MLVTCTTTCHLSPAGVRLSHWRRQHGFLSAAFTSRKVTLKLGIGPTLLVCSLLLGIGYSSCRSPA